MRILDDGELAVGASPDLRSITQGRGVFSMEFDHYQEVPAYAAQVIIEQAQKDHPQLKIADSD